MSYPVPVEETNSAQKYTFDPPEDNSRWVANTRVTFPTDLTAPTPGKVMRLDLSGGADAGGYRVLSDTNLKVGNAYRILMRVNFDSMASDQFLLLKYDGGGIGLGGNGIYLYKSPDSPLGWELQDIGTFQYDNAGYKLSISGYSATGSGVALVDGIYFGYVPLPSSYLPLATGQGPIRWQTWHTDDIMGTPMPRDEAVRDRYHRLVDVFQGLDEDAHDEIIQNPRPTERHRKDP